MPQQGTALDAFLESQLKLICKDLRHKTFSGNLCTAKDADGWTLSARFARMKPDGDDDYDVLPNDCTEIPYNGIVVTHTSPNGNYTGTSQCCFDECRRELPIKNLHVDEATAAWSPQVPDGKAFAMFRRLVRTGARHP